MSEEKIFRIKISTKNLDVLTSFLRENPIDMHETGPRREKDGLISVEAYVSDVVINRLERAGLDVEVFEDMTELGKRRQSEVGKEDRFEGGKNPPIRRRRT